MILNSYCKYCLDLEETNVHKIYHDSMYGFPISNDNELFGRLILEINQAGLSWNTILNKQKNFRKAYSNFDIAKVARFNNDDRIRLLNDAGIIRNKLKVEAAIHNAQIIEKLQSEHGSFLNWLNVNHPLTKDEWVKLFKKTFKFTGGEITNEFLMSTSFLPGAHDKNCPVYDTILASNPYWNL